MNVSAGSGSSATWPTISSEPRPLAPTRDGLLADLLHMVGLRQRPPSRRASGSPPRRSPPCSTVGTWPPTPTTAHTAGRRPWSSPSRSWSGSSGGSDQRRDAGRFICRGRSGRPLSSIDRPDVQSFPLVPFLTSFCRTTLDPGVWRCSASSLGEAGTRRSPRSGRPRPRRARNSWRSAPIASGASPN